MSDELVPQIDIVHKALDKAKIAHFEVDGYEADDLIGTISVKAKEEGLQTIIVSGDRDLLQLVNGSVLMLAPIVGITKMTLFDEWLNDRRREAKIQFPLLDIDKR